MRALAILVLSCELLLFGSRAGAEALRINQRIDNTLNDLNQKGAFAAVTPKDWKTGDCSVSPERIELTFTDANEQVHAVELLLEQPQGKVDGHGRFFHFRLGRGATSASDAEALLRAAALVDSSTPKEALVAEDPPRPPPPPPVAAPESVLPPNPPSGGVGAPPPPPPPRGWFQQLNDIQATVSRPVALALGAVQVIIIVAAVVFAMLRPPLRGA